ncbi:MAG: ankyrin repeat domain-containing protein [Candidatus Binatia bacterium]|nr:ankyrin repeat domain-containing protein [Candidatus Binatia bacterium]
MSIAVVLALALLGASCQKSADDTAPVARQLPPPSSPTVARRLLEQHGLPYTDSAFVEQARNGNTSTVALFLAAGMPANASNEFGQSALTAAGFAGHAEVMRLLLQHGASIDDRLGLSLLHHAASKGQTEIVAILLDNGVDVNAQDTVGYTALMRAAEAGQDDTVKLLIAKGADVNAQEMHGYSSLMWAVITGKHTTARVLAEHGADVNAREKKANWTALMMATIKDDVEMVRVLLEQGADPRLADTGGTTALGLAHRRRNPALIQLLERATASSSS